MSFSYIYNLIFYQPILNALIFLYKIIPGNDLGIAIVLLTILLRLILFPLFHRSTHYQIKMQALQPKLKQIKEKHRDDKEKQFQETMALYKEHGVNPMGQLILLIIQIPILIALFKILRSIGTAPPTGLYPFISAPHTLNTLFLGLINLKKSNMLLVVLAAISLYVQGKISVPKSAPGSRGKEEQLAQQMAFVGPLTMVLLFYFFPVPAAVPLYIIVSTLFSIGHQVYLTRTTDHAKLGTIRKNAH